jgi:phosphopantetheinyl transferase (holo-ACP synthase)
LVSEVLTREEFDEKVKLLNSYPFNALHKTKKLLKMEEIEKLEKVNRIEMEYLGESWTSKECMEAVMKFSQRKKSKL